MIKFQAQDFLRSGLNALNDTCKATNASTVAPGPVCSTADPVEVHTTKRYRSPQVKKATVVTRTAANVTRNRTDSPLPF